MSDLFRAGALALILVLAGCGGNSVQTRQLGDGTNQAFDYEQGVPVRAANEWASIREASFLVGQKQDGTGADFWWEFSFSATLDDLQSVIVYDVTVAPPVRAPGTRCAR